MRRGLMLLFAVRVCLCRVAAAAGVVTDCSNDTQFSTLLAGGGTVTFNCGGVGAAATITVSSVKTIAANTTIDGAGKITLSGGNARRIFTVNSGATLTLNNLTFTQGNAVGGGLIRNDGILLHHHEHPHEQRGLRRFRRRDQEHRSDDVTNSLLANNSAPQGYGGAIDSVPEAPRWWSWPIARFSNNSAQIGGGGIANNGSRARQRQHLLRQFHRKPQRRFGRRRDREYRAAHDRTQHLQATIAPAKAAASTTKAARPSSSTAPSRPTASMWRRAPAAASTINQPTGQVTIVASTFSDNTAPGGSGGNLNNSGGSTLNGQTLHRRRVAVPTTARDRLRRRATIWTAPTPAASPQPVI